MSVSRDAIIDLALRYVSEDEVGDFPVKDDLFCLLMREVPTDRILKAEEGWAFGGYGVCNGYSYDEDAKPRGKWLWMQFASLASFPPVPQVLKLQPPHVVKGSFQSADRTQEIRIVKVVLRKHEDDGAENTIEMPSRKPAAEPGKKCDVPDDKKIVAFRKKTDS